ncbi:GntR family transcriptional regulator [Primorskyibacter flagellatus]|uniref:GntR family transcriptional regulator n=1 Tax=Primorskyibacter flagellatus TaxID=1387277 RepID=A0A917AI58_9RHOB|nr:GntR family transcriptional regulator [Primorskyibacter flagellatus]GGE50269.1 GntR family transcriptional regulator [Primorskyibacter flagellatus]
MNDDTPHEDQVDERSVSGLAETDPDGAPHLNLEVFRNTTLTEQVYANLRRGMLMGVWKPDQRMSARQLSRTMNVSPTPVREAMMRLVNEGALEMTATREFRTPKLSRDAYAEITRMRMALEPMAAELAAPIISEAEIATLIRANESLEQAVSAEKFDVALEFDTEFHLGLYAAARQPLLLSTINALLLRAGPTRTRLSGEYRKSRTGLGHHKNIITALRSRDGQAARDEIAADLQDGSRVILAVLDE